MRANQFETNQPQKASKLRQASTHWLRHSYVTYLLDSGAPLKVAQENAGHSDISTTMHYRHVAQTDRFRATRLLAAERAGLSRATIGKIERGNALTSIGGYAAVLFVLGMADRLSDLVGCYTRCHRTSA